MLKLDECDKTLVSNPFAEDCSTASSSNNHGVFGAPALDSSSGGHPLHSRSASSARCCNMSVAVVGSEGETRPRSTRLLSLDGSLVEVAGEEDYSTEASEAPRDIITHPVGPHDTLAGVALRYGVSIAVLRRANQLWPSDPIHLRTELLIPRGDALRSGQKPTSGPSMVPTLRPTLEPSSDVSPDLVASTLITARNMILSVLPARISLDSLSSKASLSEDHEMDDLPAVRTHKVPAMESPFAEEDYELTVMAAPHEQYKLPSVPLSPRAPCSLANKRHAGLNRIPLTRGFRSRPISSLRTVSLERLPPRQPFAALPVRTSQLEPQPAMELHIRPPRI